ncbi:hypothetical protein AWZ03_007245 [Drosophila navojoa]|uniref:Uncharacterized protein n=1 Tax=Drosophila navojoa TaxID=7232 RepID=A0A484BBY9_DRONA|nr:hypothetical protein AWZ03_007245 [Drosophila navojoa]
MQRRMSVSIREYKFFRSFSQKFENWPKRKAEALWRKMRERKIAEIEAVEACKWLRAAGFPQYAQMYEGKYEGTHFRLLLKTVPCHVQHACPVDVATWAVLSAQCALAAE